MKKTSRFLLACLFLTGCGQHSPSYSTQSNANSSPEQQQYLLSVTEQAIENKNISAAKEAFQQLNFDRLTPKQQEQALLSESKLERLSAMNLPDKIALLLPLNGALGKQGQAIRNGFLAAFYQSKSSAGYTPAIAIYDTSQEDVNTLYQRAVHENARVVIGPLLKSDIEQLVSKQTLSVPTIALNTIPTREAIPNLYQFGLSPEDEAAQIAKRIKSDQRQRLLVIQPNTVWGQRVEKSFADSWASLGGETTATMSYESQSKFATQLRETFGLDASYQRARDLRNLVHAKLRFVPRRRQDFDAIFVVAEPSMGRQVLPLLRFFYANDVPVYSISEIYRGYPDPHADRDLNGIIFDDIPWLLNASATLPDELQIVESSIKTTWPDSFNKYPRLYALGNDAFRLITQFNKFHLLSNFGIQSATGVLYLQSNGQIYRQLTFGQIVDGTPKNLTS